METKYSTKN